MGKSEEYVQIKGEKNTTQKDVWPQQLKRCHFQKK